MIPFLIHVPLGIIIIILGFYLMQKAHVVVEPGEPGVVSTGVFARVRHPMYLGSILLYVGGMIATISMLTLIPVVIIIIVYNYLASYEEQKLEEKFGDEYREYKKKVRKWIPF